MKIEWKGHSCFLFTTKSGIRILTDPFNDKVGYPVPNVEVDYVTVSHQHYDHNSIYVFNQNFKKAIVIQDLDFHYLKDVVIHGIPSFHDSEGGAKRGKNIIFVIQADNLTIAHLGDLGHLLTSEQIRQIGHIDVLCIPIGGFYTINTHEAHEIINQLQPSVVIPMHYKYRPYVNLPIAPIDEFRTIYPDTLEMSSLDLEQEISSQECGVILLHL